MIADTLGDIGELGQLLEELLDKNPQRRMTADQARRVLGGAQGELHATPTPMTMPKSTASHNAAGVASSLLLLLMLAASLVWAAARAHVAAGDVSDFFVALLPWALLALGLWVSPYRCGRL